MEDMNAVHFYQLELGMFSMALKVIQNDSFKRWTDKQTVTKEIFFNPSHR
jgi:hypothetical protein